MARYQLLIRQIANPDWATFQKELVICYGNEPAINSYEGLIIVNKQDHSRNIFRRSMKEYHKYLASLMRTT